MALDYALELEANIQPSTLLSIANKISGIPFVSDGILRDSTSGLTISADQEDDEDCINVTKKAYGFKPLTSLNLRHGKKEHGRNDKLILTIAVGLLKDIEGDMVLEFQSESPILQRIKGKITVNSDWNDMSGIESLKEAGLIYDITKLESH